MCGVMEDWTVVQGHKLTTDHNRKTLGGNSVHDFTRKEINSCTLTLERIYSTHLTNHPKDSTTNKIEQNTRSAPQH